AFLGSVPDTFDSTRLDTRRELMYSSTLDKLDTAGIIVALKWVSRQRYEHNRGDFAGMHFVIDIMRKAWDYLGDDTVLNAFIDAVWTHIQRGNHFLVERSSIRLRDEVVRDYNHELAENEDLRRRLLRAMVHSAPSHLAQKPTTEIGTLLLWDLRKELYGFLSSYDFSWYIDQAQSEIDTQRSDIWIALACIIYDKTSSKQRALLRKLRKNDAKRTLVSSLDTCLKARKPSAKTLRLIRKYNKQEEQRKARQAEAWRRQTERLGAWLQRPIKREKD